MVLAAGRYAPSIELWNTVTGRHELAVADHPLLDINHHQLLVVDKVGAAVGADDAAAAAPSLKHPSPPTGKDIWIPCGFTGSDVNKESIAEHTVIIDPDKGFSVRRGPRIDRPRGGCGALALALDGPGTPQHVCLFGGSIGTHDQGTFTTNVTCYDRVRQQWHQPLAQLPVPADHLNVVRIPAGVQCDEKGVAPARPEQLLYLNFRDQPYGAQRSEVFALDLERDEAGRVVEQGTADKGWYELGRTDAGHANGEEVLPIPARDAAGIEVSPTGRFVFTFGGVNYVYRESSSRTATIFQDVVAFDVCTGKSVALPASTTMENTRFAVVTCKNGDNRALTCGGTANGRDNLDSCDVHDLEVLEEMALKATLGA